MVVFYLSSSVAQPFPSLFHPFLLWFLSVVCSTGHGWMAIVKCICVAWCCDHASTHPHTYTDTHSLNRCNHKITNCTSLHFENGSSSYLLFSDAIVENPMYACTETDCRAASALDCCRCSIIIIALPLPLSASDVCTRFLNTQKCTTNIRTIHSSAVYAMVCDTMENWSYNRTTIGCYQCDWVLANWANMDRNWSHIWFDNWFDCCAITIATTENELKSGKTETF